LNQATLKYKTAIEGSQKREKAIRDKIEEAKDIVQRKQTDIKQGQRTVAALISTAKKKKLLLNDCKSGRLDLCQTLSGESRVDENIAVLGATADMRRDQLYQKRNSSTSSTWVQNLPGISGPLKRSLWYKMHRRRQQIVLRPTFTSLLDGLLKQVESKFSSLKGGLPGNPDESIEIELNRAEQTYLLATHPVVPKGENIPTIPTSSASTPWAEPGTYRLLMCTVCSRIEPYRECWSILLSCSLRLASGSRCPKSWSPR
jgi:hypothetical protein